VGYCRPGGDLNYFFEPLLLGTFFCALAAQEWLERLSTLKVALLLCQLLLIAATLSVKATKSLNRHFYPYEQIAEKVSKMAGPYVLITGPNAHTMNLYLQGQSFYGPDVALVAEVATRDFNTESPVARLLGAKEKFRNLDWVYDRITSAITRKEIGGVLVAGDGCTLESVPAEPHGAPRPLLRGFHHREVLTPQYCLWLP
jgi:hypothetical protein